MLSLDCAVALEIHITREFGAAYDYYSKYAWFSRPDVALEGVASYFYHSSMEETLHAKQLVDYLSLRSTSKPTEFANIYAPKQASWCSVVDAMQHSWNQEVKWKRVFSL